MKTFLLFTVMLLLVSCSKTPTKVEDPTKETTVQIQQLAALDSTCYKVVEIKSHTYILKDNMVVKKITNYSGVVVTFGVIIVLLVALIGGCLLFNDL